MFILGLTGSIGMGKTTTARLFAEEGVPVFDADGAVHALYEGSAAPLIEAEFPGTTKDGKVDRGLLSRHVVGDTAALRRLEGIVHPLVRQSREDFLAREKARGAKIVVLDIPLLLEHAGEKHVDAVVVVSAPHAVQRERVLTRPGMDVEKHEALLAKQMPDAEKRRRADFIVDSGQGIDHARSQVRQILARVATMTPKLK